MSAHRLTHSSQPSGTRRVRGGGLVWFLLGIRCLALSLLFDAPLPAVAIAGACVALVALRGYYWLGRAADGFYDALREGSR